MITCFGDSKCRRQLEATATEEFTFHCRTHGYPRPRRYWFRSDGRPLPSDAIDDNNGTLTIPRLRFPDDSGGYMCVANNTWGEDRTTATLEVKRKGTSSEVLLISRDVMVAMFDELSTKESH